MSYSTGTVYKIVCSLDNNIVYIGSTFNQLRHRWQMHKSFYKSYLEGKNRCISIYTYFTKYGIDNFKIMKIKDYECYRENKADARHLHAFEQLWINKTRNCINQNNPFRIDKLSEKYYREKNKDRQKEYREANKDKKSEYREANKDKISKKCKEYYEANKEKTLERNKQRVNCSICDKELARAYLQRHMKTIH
jgi:hypothetical protein